MKLKMNVYLKGIKGINREIQVNDNMTLQDFCEYVIVAMNGNCKHLYQLLRNEEYTYLGPGCVVIDFCFEEMMEDTTLEDLGLGKGEYFLLNYDFRSDWDFIIEIKSVANGYYEKDFEVVKGNGVGILEDSYGIGNLKVLLNPKLDEVDKDFYYDIVKGYKKYDNKVFDISTINMEIEDFFNNRRELVKPKNYIMSVTLHGYEKEIKRKIAVDSNVELNNFCRLLILSMKGDLSHSYGLKIGNNYIDDEELFEQDLNYLELKEKQRFKVVYDFGDNWVFDVRVSKIVKDYGRKRFEVLSGKGYGIIDDCGGVGCLYEIFNGIDKNWGNHDINDFDLDDINMVIDMNY